jgi:hypothetical protein
MPNERLCAALLEGGLTPARLADVTRVDAKTVARWKLDQGSHHQLVPRDLMGRLFSKIQEQIGVQAGARVRFLLGGPNPSQAAERGADEGFEDARPLHAEA